MQRASCWRHSSRLPGLRRVRVQAVRVQGVRVQGVRVRVAAGITLETPIDTAGLQMMGC